MCQELFQVARSYPHVRVAQKSVLRCARQDGYAVQMPRRQDTASGQAGVLGSGM